MKKLGKQVFKGCKYSLILLLLVIVVGCSTQERESDLLVVGTTPTYPPYEGFNSDGECEGFDIDVAQALAEKLEKKLVIKELDFDALILGLKQGKIDLVISGMSITPSRLKEIAMVPYQGESVTTLTLTFWEKVPENYSSMTDLKVVAVQVGTYQEAYLQSLDNLKTKSLEGNAEIIMDLKYGKSSTAAFEPQIAQAMKSQFQQLQLVELPMEEKGWVLGYGIGVKKGNETLIQDVTGAINELKDENVIQQLESKWLES